jgi:membrane-bound lytic murein transglycosylase B
MNATAIRGSYAGALGIPQFMPSSYRKYAVDFDGDGKVDLLNSPVDAIGSVANYLKQNGWSAGGDITARAKPADGVDSLDLTLTARSLPEWAKAGIVTEEPSAETGSARLLTFTMPDDSMELWLAFGNFDVIMKYNRSYDYARSVFQLAQALKSAHSDAQPRP